MLFNVYTDGACSGNGQKNAVAAYAYVVVNGDKAVIRSGSVLPATNGRAELAAVVEFLRSVTKPNNEFILHVDSEYIVYAINNKSIRQWQNNGWKRSDRHDVANADLWSEYINNIVRLYKLGCAIRVEKVAGHSGDKYNEMADKAAKEAVQAAKEKVCII